MIERPRFCPFCGAPVGSFFGRHDVTGAVWCEACETWFVATAQDLSGTDHDLGAFPDNEGITGTGETA